MCVVTPKIWTYLGMEVQGQDRVLEQVSVLPGKRMVPSDIDMAALNGHLIIGSGLGKTLESAG